MISRPLEPDPNGPSALSTEGAAALGRRITESLLREHGSWKRAIRAATREGLLPLVRFAVAQGLVDAPRDLETCYAVPGVVQKLVPVLRQETAAAVSRALESHGIAHAFMKGVALAPRYGRLHLRPMSDIDVVVAPDQAHAAEEVLIGLDYTKVAAGETEACFVSKSPGLLRTSVDLHFDLGQADQFGFPIEQMLERARRQGAIRVFAPEDEILALAVHVARHRMVSVGRSVCDIAVLAATSILDWDFVVRNALACRVGVATWAALSCAKKALGARVPNDVLARLRPSLLHETYLSLWLDLHRLSPYRLAGRGYSALPRRAATLFLWPALSGGLVRGAMFVTRYFFRSLWQGLLARSRIGRAQGGRGAPPRSCGTGLHG